ncbi:hypothetical protein ABEV34_04750 [Methylorubrum rhodesianum]|uniref:hypothetical protein n=1 Tax=Methylorubrum rhodesianum TaxID=29427 RepID=UPI003D2962FC
MAKPFVLTLVEGVTAPSCKPGWHKRSLAAERAASKRRTSVAPQYGDGRATAKAIEYAGWIAARDGIALPGDGEVVWDSCGSQMRPRSVIFGRGIGAVTIDLPHWDYVAPAVVETELLEWAAPVVREIEAEAPTATESENPADLTTGEPVSRFAPSFEAPKNDMPESAEPVPPASNPAPKVSVPVRGIARTVTAFRALSAPIPPAIASRALAARLCASAAYQARSL